MQSRRDGADGMRHLEIEERGRMMCLMTWLEQWPWVCVIGGIVSSVMTWLEHGRAVCVIGNLVSSVADRHGEWHRIGIG